MSGVANFRARVKNHAADRTPNAQSSTDLCRIWGASGRTRRLDKSRPCHELSHAGVSWLACASIRQGNQSGDRTCAQSDRALFSKRCCAGTRRRGFSDRVPDCSRRGWFDQQQGRLDVAPFQMRGRRIQAAICRGPYRKSLGKMARRSPAYALPGGFQDTGNLGGRCNARVRRHCYVARRMLRDALERALLHAGIT